MLNHRKLKNVSSANKSLQDIFNTLKYGDSINRIEAFIKGIHNTKLIVLLVSGEQRVHFYNRLDLASILNGVEVKLDSINEVINNLNLMGYDFNEDDLEIVDNRLMAKITSLGYIGEVPLVNNGGTDPTDPKFIPYRNSQVILNGNDTEGDLGRNLRGAYLKVNGQDVPFTVDDYGDGFKYALMEHGISASAPSFSGATLNSAYGYTFTQMYYGQGDKTVEIGNLDLRSTMSDRSIANQLTLSRFAEDGVNLIYEKSNNSSFVYVIVEGDKPVKISFTLKERVGRPTGLLPVFELVSGSVIPNTGNSSGEIKYRVRLTEESFVDDSIYITGLYTYPVFVLVTTQDIINGYKDVTVGWGNAESNHQFNLMGRYLYNGLVLAEQSITSPLKNW